MFRGEVFSAASAALQEVVQVAQPVVGVAPPLEHLNHHQRVVPSFVSARAS